MKYVIQLFFLKEKVSFETSRIEFHKRKKKGDFH